MTQFGIDLTQFKQAEGNLFSINGGSVNAAAKRPWIIGESGEELAPPKRTKISEEILTNELNPNNATKTDKRIEGLKLLFQEYNTTDFAPVSVSSINAVVAFTNSGP